MIQVLPVQLEPQAPLVQLGLQGPVALMVAPVNLVQQGLLEPLGPL